MPRQNYDGILIFFRSHIFNLKYVQPFHFTSRHTQMYDFAIFFSTNNDVDAIKTALFHRETVNDESDTISVFNDRYR